ncbi:MAG: cupin [Alphaproteobacteria bacterium]|nr:cupin [Alphaproteobacteria bacterium]
MTGGDASEANALIVRLRLQPHPEGGHFRETFRDENGDARAHSTAILFLLKEGEISRWHKVDAAEIWHFYRGDPLEILIAENGKPRTRHVLGNRIEEGETPQVIVPAHAWQAARPLGVFTLVGCTVAPGFSFSGFELAAPGFEP